MNDRRFLLTSVAGVLAAPLAGEAQQVRRVGFLGTLSASDHAFFLKAFRQGLRDVKYEEGKTLLIECCWAEGHAERLPTLAARERGAALL